MLNVGKWSVVLACAQLLLIGCRPKVIPVGVPGDIVVVEIKGRALRLEVASDALSRHTGLMERQSLAKDAGMLFIYPDRDRLSFYMKNTYIDLSIAFVDDSGKILQIEDMQHKDETPIVSNYEVRYAVEVKKGWFQSNGIGVGDSFSDLPEKVRAYHVTP